MSEDMSKILEEIKKLVEEKKYSGGTFLNEDLKTILDYITNLQQEIERLHSIIKEVREKVEELAKLYDDNYTVSDKAKDVLEILKDSDKE